MKKTLVLIFTFFICINWLKADTDVFGYFENRFYLVNTLDAEWDSLNEKFQMGDYNRVRLQFKGKPSSKVAVNIALDLFTFEGILTSPLGTYENAGDQNNSILNSKLDIDRAYVDLYFDKFDVTIGKQRVAMGVSYIWAPLDIFNRVNVFEPKEEKPGSNAIKAYVPLGTQSSLTGVVSPSTDFRSSRSGVRAKTNIAGVDAALSYIYSGDNRTAIYGIDLRGEHFIGWWIEGGYFSIYGENHQKVAVGFDFTFPIGRGLYWLNEFFYDSTGQKESDRYDYEQILEGSRFTLAQRYFFSMLRFSFSDFLSASVSYIGNWDDGSYIVNPSVQYEISQNVSFSTGFYFPLGPVGGEFRMEKRDIYFMWLKINF